MNGHEGALENTSWGTGDDEYTEVIEHVQINLLLGPGAEISSWQIYNSFHLILSSFDGTRAFKYPEIASDTV